LVVVSLEQWFDERPSYRQLMTALTESSDWAVREIDTFLRSGSGAIGSDAAPPAPDAGRTGPGHYGIGPIRSLWERLDTKGQQLLAAAVLLMVVLKVPEDLMPPPVADVATPLGHMLSGEFPDDIGLLSSRITARP
jgi:hypothetical protein